MKKLLMIITSLLILLNLTGCGIKEVKDVEIILFNAKNEVAKVNEVKENYYITNLGIIYKNELDKTYEVGGNITLNYYNEETYLMEIEDENGIRNTYPILTDINQLPVRLPKQDMPFTKSNKEANIVFQFRTNIGDFYKDVDDNYLLTTDTFYDGSKNTTYFLEKDYTKPTHYTMISGYRIEYVDATDGIYFITKE